MVKIVRGIYRTHGSGGFSNDAKVATVTSSFYITEAVYRERGIEPKFDDFPWKEEYDAANKTCPWLPISTVPFDADLEVCVMDDHGIHELVSPCRKCGAGWIDVSTKRYVDIQPTHWRKWTDGK